MSFLKFIDEKLTAAGVPYEFGEWTAAVIYPYSVGEYTEVEGFTEDGQEDKTFILNVFSRDTYLSLEEIKELVKTAFPPIEGATAILDDGSGIAVFYSTAFPVPTGEEELKKLQINLSVKLWKVV